MPLSENCIEFFQRPSVSICKDALYIHIHCVRRFSYYKCIVFTSPNGACSLRTGLLLMYSEFHRKVFNKWKLVNGELVQWIIWNWQIIWNLSFIYQNRNKMSFQSMASSLYSWLVFSCHIFEYSVFQVQCKHLLWVNHLILTHWVSTFTDR